MIFWNLDYLTNCLAPVTGDKAENANAGTGQAVSGQEMREFLSDDSRFSVKLETRSRAMGDD